MTDKALIGKAFLILVIFTLILNINTTNALSASTVKAIIGRAIKNPAVYQDLSNSSVVNYLGDNPTVLNYFIENSTAINYTLTDPILLPLESNPARLIGFLANPSLGSVLANPTQFNKFISNSSNSKITANPDVLAAFLSNPSLSEIMNNQNGLYSLILSKNFSAIMNNQNAFTNLLANPSLGAISQNSSSFLNFTSNPGYSTLSDNPAAMSSLMSNPNLVTLISLNSFDELVTNSSFGNLLSGNQFTNFLGNPALSLFLSNPSLQYFMNNTSQFTEMINNPALEPIVDNPVQFASLMSNPSINLVLTNQSGLATLLAYPAFSNIISNNPAAISNLLSNPSLSMILANPKSMTGFLASTSSLNGLLSDPEAMTMLFGNPSLYIIVSNPSGLAALISNSSVSTMIKNATIFTSLLGGQQLGAIANNSLAFTSIASNYKISYAMGEPQIMVGFINNPSLSQVLPDSGQAIAMLDNPYLSGLVGNPSELSALLSNPNLNLIVTNQSAFASFVNNPSFSGVVNAAGFNGLLANPSLSAIITNPGMLAAFMNNNAFEGVLSNDTEFANLLANPSLSNILGNQSLLGGFLSNDSFSSIVQNPDVLAAFLSNPSIIAVLENQQALFQALNNPGMSDIVTNPNLLSALVANPSLTSVMGNPSLFANFFGNSALGNFAASASFRGFLSNPSISGFINNKAFYDLIGSETPETLGAASFARLSGSAAFADLLSNPAIYSIIGNPELSGFLANPDISAVLDNQGFSDFMSNPSLSYFINSGSLSILSNKGLEYTINNYGISGLLGNPQIAYIVNGSIPGLAYSNAEFNGASAKPALYTQSGSGNATSPALLVGGEGLGSCPGSSPAFGVCTYPEVSIVTTDFSDTAGFGSITPVPSISQPSPTPLIKSVLNNNLQAGQYLLTCPNDPDPQNTTLYYTVPGTYIAGNSCLANLPELVTTIEYTTYVSWSLLSPAFAYTTGPTIQDIGQGSASSVAYSGQTQNQGFNGFNISSGYNSNSYIFEQVPSSPQYGLWTWTEQYANLSQTDLSDLNLSQTFQGLQFEIPGLCQYTYDYSVHSFVVGINNTNITVPQFNRSAIQDQNYINFSNYIFAPITTEPSTQCFNNLLVGIECGGWARVSNSGSVDINGNLYKHINIYISTQDTSDPSPDYDQAILAVYPNGYAQADATLINYTNTTAAPYLLYNLSIPSSYTQLSQRTEFLNMSYNLYSTHNLLNPPQSLDPIALYQDSGFFGTYNGYLSAFPVNLTSINNPDPDSLSNIQQNFTSSLFAPQAAALSFGGNNGNPYTLGKYAYGKIYNPISIAASPNGYIYVLNYSQNSCWLCIGTDIKSYLFVLKYIPQGYYNISNDQPAAQPNPQGSQQTWQNEWQNYYQNALYEGSQNLYLTNIYLMTSASSSWWTGTRITQGAQLGTFVPLALTTDISGDLFILGAHLSSALGFGSGNGFMIDALLSNGEKVANQMITQPNNFVPSSEFTASPDGEFVYAANASYGGEVEIYATILSNGIVQNTISNTPPVNTMPPNTIQVGNCPNSDFQGVSMRLTFAQVDACAQNAGFSGTQLVQIIAIAYAESSFKPNVFGGGTSSCLPGQGAEGILQLGQCGTPEEEYPLPNYNPASCSTYLTNGWSGIYYNPSCAFQWAYAFYNQGQTTCSRKYGVTLPSGDYYCFWGTFWRDNLNGVPYSNPAAASEIDYCQYEPTTYSGYKCAQGTNNANLPWGNTGGGGGGGPVGTNPSLAPFSGFIYVGNVPLSYSNATYNLDIAKYLANGGPYNDSQIASAYQGMSGIYDVASNHHPVAIVDSEGILYVIDNWTFTVDNLQSSVLMLRAFSENGIELPIDPEPVNVGVPVSSSGNAVQGIITSNAFSGGKPYGWPISANISIPGGGTVSYCVAFCTKGPSSPDIGTGYPPIGPRTDYISGGVGKGGSSISISSDFNGTLYIMAHPWSYVGACIEVGCGYAPQNPLYSELLVLKPNLQNYTKISYADNSSFLCYINKSVTEDACIYDENTASVLGNLNPPVLGVPSAFSYVENLGSPEESLNFQTAFSTLLPTGNTLASTSNPNSNIGLNFGTIVTNSFSSNYFAPSNTFSTYLKSKVNGYVLNPYNTTVELDQKWNFYGGVPESIIPCPPFSISTSSSTTTYTFAAVQLQSGNTLNDTIEGGDTYLQYLPDQTNYVQNISDAGLIMPPYLNYQIFTNRLLGEAYINQTVSPETATLSATARSSLPVVINATRNYNYQLNQYQQVTQFGTFPAYYTQQAMAPTSNPNQTILGANCGSACPLNYYYSDNYYGGNSQLNYSSLNITQYFQLFELYKRESYLANLVLNVPNQDDILGYNRLVYTFVDRFNNTIYMPLDVDFANITQIAVSSSPQIDPQNANHTIVNISGNAAYTTLSGTYPIPQGSSIYLYYDGNLGYYNTTSSPYQNQQSYYKWALNCEISPNSKSCIVANPLSTQTQQQPYGVQEAQATSYHTNYASSGSCAQQPNSLLATAVYNCNLFGNYNLPSVQFNNNIGAYQYCMPQFINGTGTLSSQLGLIGIAKTDANGNFKYTFNACGVGLHAVTAYYYGGSAPEPILVSQTSLVYSGGPNEANPNSNQVVSSPEFNYSYAPGYSTTQFETGSYALGFGNIGFAGLIATLAIIIAIVSRRKSEGKRG